MATKGIDVSVWQGTIDFNAVRNSGVDFVIIRAGYGTSSKDKYFEENYRNAKSAGLHVGAYWYSYADSFSEAAQEAENKKTDALHQKAIKFIKKICPFGK